MKIILYFLVGITIGFVEFQILLPVFKPVKVQVLAQTIESTPESTIAPPIRPTTTAIPSASAFATPFNTPIPQVLSLSIVTPKPTTMTEIPKPTVVATLQATSSPISTQTPHPTTTPTSVTVPTSTPDVWSPPNLDPLFAQYAGQFGVDKNILERIVNCESHFNPSARNGDYVGLFQFNASTWRTYRTQLGLDPSPDLRTNPEESIKTGAFLVSKRGIAPWPSCL